jgi:hypothetical protein
MTYNDAHASAAKDIADDMGLPTEAIVWLWSYIRDYDNDPIREEWFGEVKDERGPEWFDQFSTRSVRAWQGKGLTKEQREYALQIIKTVAPHKEEKRAGWHQALGTEVLNYLDDEFGVENVEPTWNEMAKLVHGVAREMGLFPWDGSEDGELLLHEDASWYGPGRTAGRRMPPAVAMKFVDAHIDEVAGDRISWHTDLAKQALDELNLPFSVFQEIYEYIHDKAREKWGTAYPGEEQSDEEYEAELAEIFGYRSMGSRILDVDLPTILPAVAEW